MHGSTGRGWKRSRSYRASPSPNQPPISSAAIHMALSPSTSGCSSPSSLFASWGSGHSGPVGHRGGLLRRSRGTDRRFSDTAVAELTSGPLGSYTTIRDLTPEIGPPDGAYRCLELRRVPACIRAHLALCCAAEGRACLRLVGCVRQRG